MFLCVLLGGMTVGLAIGLLDVLTVHADAISSQGKASGRRCRPGPGPAAARRRRAAGSRPPAPPAADTSPGRHGAAGEAGEEQLGSPGAGAEPQLGLAALAGALAGLPGASYIAALHHLVAGKYSTATQVIAIVVFVVIEFLLILVPFAFLELRPEATKALLKRAQDWLLSHALQLMAGIALALGA